MWPFLTKMSKEKMALEQRKEKETVEQELSVIMELTLRLEDELNFLSLKRN